MRKALSLIVLLLVVSGAFAQSAPVLDRPNTVVIDLWKYGRRYEDYVKVSNATSIEKLSFVIYGYTGKRWVVIGRANITTSGDTDTVDSNYNGELKSFRWIAVQSLEGHDFDYSIAVRHHDILINVLERYL